MKVGIIGAGFTGLAAAYKLSKKGIEVVVLEKEERLAGLATGFRGPSWDWSLEKHYHHLFTSDNSIINLANEVNHKIIFSRPKTSVFVDGKIMQLDSPINLLNFSRLTLMERLRTGAVLFYLKATPFWGSLEGLTAEGFLKKFMGENSWKILWQPLLEKKFEKYAKEIPASWFWARIKKRSASLGYPEGGFESLAESLEREINKNGGKIYYQTSVASVAKMQNKFRVKTDRKEYEFEKVICTLPTPAFIKIAEGLPSNYKEELLKLKGLGAVDLVLSLKRQFLTDGTYWLNINETEFPFLAVVEHTNFMDSGIYNNEKLVYVANHLAPTHEYFGKSASELLEEFLPYLKRINPQFDKSWVNRLYIFKAPFIQPIIPLNYSKILPPIKTPIEGLYLANIQQVYPWDRGTNYAVELGEKVAGLVLKS